METPIGSALLHPVAVGGLLILILNDHVLKSAYPGAVTGKVSDLAGLAFFPFFLQAAYEAWCAVRRAGPVSRSTSLWVASVITGVGFVVVEVTAIGDASYRGALGLLQWIPGAAWALVGGSTLPVLRPVAATPDPTDLAALVVLPLLNLASLRRIRRPWPMPGRARMARIERMVGAALLVIGLTATVATTPAPPPESSVGGAYTVAIELSADRPVAIGEIAVRLNQAALTTEVRPRALATLKLVPEKDAEGPEGRSLTTDDLADLVTIRATPTADDEPPVISAGAAPDGVLFFTHDPAWGVDTCREGEACERTYQVLLELRDVSDAPLRFNLVAEGEIHYTLPEAPVGAAIAIDAVGELDTRAPVPTVHSEAQGVVELSRFEDVELHVRVTRSAGAVVQELDAAVMLSIDELDELPEEASPRVNVFLGDENRVRPENGERYQYGAEDLPRSILVVPFGSCQAGSECTVEYNIRLSLCCSSGEDFAAWSAGPLRPRFAISLPRSYHSTPSSRSRLCPRRSLRRIWFSAASAWAGRSSGSPSGRGTCRPRLWTTNSMRSNVANGCRTWPTRTGALSATWHWRAAWIRPSPFHGRPRERGRQWQAGSRSDSGAHPPQRLAAADSATLGRGFP